MRRHSLSPCLSQLFHGSVLWEFKIQQVKRFFNTILNYGTYMNKSLFLNYTMFYLNQHVSVNSWG